MQHSFQKYTLALLLILMLVGCYISVTSYAKNTLTEETFEYSYTLNNIEYSGLYTGEISSNGLPSGKGKFSADSESSATFTYLGEFKDGLFDGEGTYTYSDGSYLECTFSSGIPIEKGKITYPDGSYREVEFSDIGIPFGSTATYSANHQLLNYTFYNNGELLTTLIQNAQTISYGELYRNPNKYYGALLKINGTVLHTYENESSCIFKIQDKDKNIYWGSYRNTSYNKYNQAIMPTLKKGDVLTLYAFSKGLTSYYCIDDMSNRNVLTPEVSAITADLKDESLDYKTLTSDYNTILRFPFHYYEQEISLKGHIVNLVKNGEKTYIKISDSKNNIYYIVPKKKKLLSNMIPGDFISVKGYYNGLYKEYNATIQRSALLYPLIKTSQSIELLK